MRRLILAWILMSLSYLCGQNWQTINNTNHVYDIIKRGNDIYFSTWGGVVHVQGADEDDFPGMQEVRHWTTGDGLVSNEIRNLGYINFTGDLWMGSAGDGISIQGDKGLQNLDIALGLPSERINDILEWGSFILVATAQGLAKYYYLPGVSFPLMLKQYNTINIPNLLSDNITGLELTADSTLVLATDAGINYVKLDSLDINDSWHSVQVTAMLTPGHQYLISANQSKIAIANRSDVFMNDLNFSHNTWESVVLHPEADTLVVSAIELDSNGDLWVAYGDWDQTLLRYDNDTTLLLSQIGPSGSLTAHRRGSSGLGMKEICGIFELDSEIYISTWGDGIARWENGEWIYFYPNSIGFPRITAAATDLDGSMWFCSGNIGDDLVPKGTLGVSKYHNGQWTNYNTFNSPLHSDNIIGLAVDAHNRKWFGAWDSSYLATGWYPGISILDEEANTWTRLTRSGTSLWDWDRSIWLPWAAESPTLLGNTNPAIHKDLYGNMLVACYDDGVTVIDSDMNHVANFTLKNNNAQRVTSIYHNGRQYFFGTEVDRGLSIWNDDSIPVTNGEHWVDQIPSDLTTGTIYGVASTLTPYSGWYHFIASGSGLYMWDETNWYRYDTYIKRYRFNFSTATWLEDTLYYADEERFFGGVSTVPNSIYADPFGRVWVGSFDYGITMYNPITERFTSYAQDNSPLLSNRVISLSYDPFEGNLLIGTPDGLNTLSIGRTVKPVIPLGKVKAFPNPFRPDGVSSLQIVNLPENSMPRGTNKCSIFSASGALVMELKENPFARFEWDGTNKAGKLVSSGIYFYVVTDSDGDAKRGKIAIIRD
jgi:ligand-binding sensor domain-containing protein